MLLWRPSSCQQTPRKFKQILSEDFSKCPLTMTRRKKRRERDFTFVSNESGFQQGRLGEGGSEFKHVRSMNMKSTSRTHVKNLQLSTLAYECDSSSEKAKIHWLVNLAYLGSSKTVSYSVTNKQNRNKGQPWYLTTVLGLSCSLHTHVYTHSFQDWPNLESVDVHPQWLCVQASLLCFFTTRPDTQYPPFLPVLLS